MKLLKKSLRKHNYRRVIACFLTYLVFFNTSLRVARAGPEGAQVVNGEVAIQQSAYNTTITASDKAIINYSSFDIARPETVQFIQPGSSASVLNRILSANPTNINGTLLANGRVFFVNPAGVYIGNGARINVNQLVASGLNISNADFINGNYNFAGGNGAVINDGDISAQQVYLIGKQVTNSGNISCPDGYVVMAAGDRVFLGEPGSDIVLDASSLTESADAADSGVGVLNEGTVDAAGGIIALAAAGDIYSQAISNVGSLSTSVEAGEAGEISLAAAGGEVINAGTIEASGSEGGQIAMEGARVGQFGTVHADGAAGDGGNVDLTASDVVALSSDSLTTANAGVNGNGGEVIVYSPDTALFWPDARIEAKGGSESGDGGFVEVSGKEHVEVYGVVDTGAPSGQGGTFYLDPFSIAIDDAGDQDGSWVGLTWTPTADTSIVTPASILSTLNANTVIVDATVGGGVTGQITVNSSIDLSDETGTLRLLAETDIDQDATITNIGNGMNLELLAKNGVDIGADITATGTGNVTINADNDSSGTGSIIRTAGTITMAGGDLRLVAGSGIGTSSDSIETAGLTDVAAATTTGDIFINNSTSGIVNVTTIDTTVGLNSGAGDISLLNTGRDVTVSSAINTVGGDFTSSGVNFDNTGGTITTAGGDVDVQNTGNVTIGAAINAGAGDVDIDGGAGVATSIGGSGTITSSGTITFDASGSIGVVATAINTAGTGAISAASTDSDIYIDNTGDVTDLRLIADSGTIAFTNTGSIDTGADITANSISLTSSGTMTIDQAVTADSGAVTLSGALVDIDEDVAATGNVDIDATGNVDVDNGRIIAGGTGTALTIDGAGITLNAGGSGTETVTNTGEGTITITDSLDTTLDNHSISIGEGTLTIDSANIYADSGNTQDEIDADGDISLTGADIGGTNAIDIAGDAGDSTLTINSNGGGVGIRVNDDLFDAVDITIASAVANNFNIDWGSNYEIDMQTDGAALTITDIDTSNFAPDVTITQSAGNVTVTSVDTGGGNFDLTASSGSIAVDTISTTDAADVTLDSSAGITSADPDDDVVDITTGDFIVTGATGVGASGSALDIDATTSNITASGDVFFDVVGADGHATTIDLSSGSIEIDGRNTLADGGYEAITLANVDTDNGAVTVYNYDNALTATSVTAGGSNNIQLTTTTAGDVLLGAVDATGDQVTVTSAAAIEHDSTDDGTAEIVATTIELNAETGIGASGSFDVTGTSISAGTTGGAIDLDSLATAGVTVTSLTTGTGSIQFDQTTGGQALGVDLATTGDGAITLTNDNATLTATSVTAGGNNNIQLTTTTAGDVLLGAVDAAGDQVTVTSAAAIEHDGTDDGTAEIVATTIDLNAATGIGAGGSFDVTGTSISADTTVGAIDLDSLATAGVTATSLTTGTGSIQFDQTGGQTLGVDLATTADGAIVLTNDDAALTATSVTAGGNNNIQLTTTTAGDVLLGAVDAAGDQVTVTSVAAIEHDGTDDGAAEIVATTIDLNAATGIGADDSFDVTGTSISADTTDGAIDLDSLATAGVTATSLTTGTGSIQFAQTGGQTLDVTLAATADGAIILTNNATLTATSVTAGGNNAIQLTTIPAGDIDVGTLTAGNAIILRATAGAITQSAGIITVNSGTLAMVQSDPLDTKDYTFANQDSTDLILQSTNGSVTSDNAQVLNAADKWQSITATAENNIILQGTGDIKIGGDITSSSGGVSIISDGGTVRTAGDTILDNVAITGTSNQAGGIGVGLPFDNGQKTAIRISSKDNLTLGTGATLNAWGIYDPAVNDDRQSVGFADLGLDAGDAIDIAIYIGSVDTPIVDVRSSVTNIGLDGTMVIDAFDTVTFGDAFESSAFNVTHWLEVVSRDSDTLQEVVVGDRLPYAFNPEGIRTWFDGTYVLRGKELFAEILALANPAPLAPPSPLELELGGEVERPDTEALAQLLSELGIGVQPFVTEAYATSLSTDLRLYKAAEKLQQLIPILEDADGTRIAGLREAVAQFFPTLDVLSDEQMDSFAQQLASHKGDGTDFDMAGQCIFALIDYVNILGTEIGWPVEKSVEFVMGRYVPRLTEGDEIRIAVVQMHLQKAQAEPGA